MCLYSSVHSFHSARDQKHTEASGFRYLLTLRFDTLGSSDAYRRYKKCPFDGIHAQMLTRGHSSLALCHVML